LSHTDPENKPFSETSCHSSSKHLPFPQWDPGWLLDCEALNRNHWLCGVELLQVM